MEDEQAEGFFIFIYLFIFKLCIPGTAAKVISGTLSLATLTATLHHTDTSPRAGSGPIVSHFMAE